MRRTFMALATAAAALVLALLVSTLVGLANGLIVEKLQVTSLVSTLGMATLLSGIGLAYSNTQDILTVPPAVTALARQELLGLPMSVFYALAAMLVVGLVLRYLPVGRKLRAVGANPRAAALTGIRPGLYRIASFTFGGLLAGIAGVVITGQLGSATASGTANGLLLPIFAAVFLGSTAFTPGRQNVLGMFVATLFLAFVSSGLVLLGAPLWASPLINGSALILAVAFSTWRRACRPGGCARSSSSRWPNRTRTRPHRPPRRPRTGNSDVTRRPDLPANQTRQPR